MPFGLNFFGKPKESAPAQLAPATVQKNIALEQQLNNTVNDLNTKIDGLNKQ
jgi:hypothetical protein